MLQYIILHQIKTMKTGIVLIPMLATCLAVFVGCGDKDNDYRDTWLGTYEGYCDYHSSTGADHQFDTVYTNQSLSVSKQGDEGLELVYLGQTFQVHCSQDGTFTSTSNNPHSEWNGCFKGDSLFFNYYDVSQGHSSTRHFKGKKK